jgi:hypothetical protein
MLYIGRMDHPRQTDDPIARAFEAEALADDDSAARAMLAAGRPIHIVREGTPEGFVIRRYPDGREELVPSPLAGLARAPTSLR